MPSSRTEGGAAPRRPLVTGTLIGVGVGPGDPELVTVKAARLLGKVPVVAYPQSRDGASLARAIVDAYVPEGVVELPFTIPMADRPAAGQAYDEAATLIAVHLEADRDVAVLCEGDPFLYGSFAQLHERLAEDYEVAVIPGLSSVTAASAVLGRPLVQSDERLTVIPATLADERLQAGLLLADAAVIVKVGRHLPRLRALLDRLALTDRATYVERATMPEERILPMAEVPPDAAPYFSLIVVHGAIGEA